MYHECETIEKGSLVEYESILEWLKITQEAHEWDIVHFMTESNYLQNLKIFT